MDKWKLILFLSFFFYGVLWICDLCGSLAGNFGTVIVHRDKTTQDADSAVYLSALTSGTGGRLSDPGYLHICLALGINFFHIGLSHDKVVLILRLSLFITIHKFLWSPMYLMSMKRVIGTIFMTLSWENVISIYFYCLYFSRKHFSVILSPEVSTLQSCKMWIICLLELLVPLFSFSFLLCPNVVCFLLWKIF